MLRRDVLPLRIVRGVVVERFGETGMQRADHDVRLVGAGGPVQVDLLVQREARLLCLLGRRGDFLPQVLHVVVEMPLLGAVRAALPARSLREMLLGQCRWGGEARHHRRETQSLHRDRKSTRLNSSHSQISYAVFCLKKKITTKTITGTR